MSKNPIKTQKQTYITKLVDILKNHIASYLNYSTAVSIHQEINEVEVIFGAR